MTVTSFFTTDKKQISRDQHSHHILFSGQPTWETACQYSFVWQFKLPAATGMAMNLLAEPKYMRPESENSSSGCFFHVIPVHNCNHANLIFVFRLNQVNLWIWRKLSFNIHQIQNVSLFGHAGITDQCVPAKVFFGHFVTFVAWVTRIEKQLISRSRKEFNYLFS